MADRNHPVGYGRPPKHSQFQKGKSGNPRGRPKKERSLAAELEAELSRKITAMEGGRPVKLTKGELLVRTTVSKAIKGDTPLIRLVFQINSALDKVIYPADGQDNAPPPSLPTAEEDDAILARYEQRIRMGGHDE